MLVRRFGLGYVGLLVAFILLVALLGGCLPPWRS